MKYSFILIVSLIIFGFSLNTVFALTVSPPKIEISGDAGRVINSEILLINEEKETKTFYSSFGNFEAQGESGVPNFTSSTTGIASWMNTQDSITINSGESIRIPFTISVPINTDPGGYFGAMFWSTVPPVSLGGGNVSIGAKLSTIILLTVNGETNEAGGLLEFKTLNGDKIFSSTPITFYYRFKNDGQNRVRPTGNINIKNTFGGIVEKLSANPTDGNILPKSIRRFEIGWGSQLEKGFWNKVKYEWRNFHFGIYTAELDASYGKNNERINEDYSFFMIPWHLLLVVIIALGLLLFGLWEEILHYKRTVLKHMKAQFELMQKNSKKRKNKV